jgi:putative component of toxin-antitoxin plasmid stabilization module
LFLRYQGFLESLIWSKKDDRLSEKLEIKIMILNCKCSNCGELHTVGVDVSTLECSCGNIYEIWFHNAGPFLKKVDGV